MEKFVRIALLFVAILCLMAVPAMAQESSQPLIEFSGAFGAGLVTIGAALGIARLASAALDAMARQPEVAGTAQITMIIAAALIEGFTFFALVVCQGQNPFTTGG